MNPPSDCLPTGISAFRPPSDGLPTTLPTAFQHPSDGCVPTPHTPHASEAAFSGPWWPLSGSHAGHRKEMAMTATALVTCEMPQPWSLKRAGCASPKLSPAAVSVSTAAHPRAGSAIAPVVAEPSYPQSGGCMLIASQYQCDGCDVPIRGPSAGPCPGARPSARPARRPIGAPDCDPHPSSWKAAGEGVPVRNWRSRPSSCLSPAPFPSPEYLCQADRNSHCPTIFQPCARTSGLSANPLSARVNRRCVAGVSWQ